MSDEEDGYRVSLKGRVSVCSLLLRRGMRSYLRSSVVDQILQQIIRNILRRSMIIISKYSSFRVHLRQCIPKPRIAGFL
jgi:hypothetical protein